MLREHRMKFFLPVFYKPTNPSIAAVVFQLVFYLMLLWLLFLVLFFIGVIFKLAFSSVPFYNILELPSPSYIIVSFTNSYVQTWFCAFLFVFFVVFTFVLSTRVCCVFFMFHIFFRRLPYILIFGWKIPLLLR